MRKEIVVLVVGAALIGCSHAKNKADFDAYAKWPEPKTNALEQEARERLARIAETNAIYFQYDQAMLDEPELAKLRELASAMKDVPSAKVVIQGNCDERGTEEYNLVLGQKRAENAGRYINAMGIAADRLSAVSMGESRALPAEAAGEVVWARDRRDEFLVIDQRDVNVARAQ